MAGCGSADRPRLDSADATQLHAELATAGAAAQRGDRAGTLNALREVKTRIGQLSAAELLAPDDARALKAGLSRAFAAAERQLARSAPTPIRTPTATKTPSPPVSALPATPSATPAEHPTPRHHPKDHHGHKKDAKGPK